MLAERVAIPERVRAMDLLERVDYADAFAAGISAERAPLAWAALISEPIRGPLREFVYVVHHHLFGWRVVRAEAEHPVGWTVLAAKDGTFVLGADGPRACARLVGTSTEGRLVLTTLLRHDSRSTRVAWWFVAPIHRAFARYFVHHAASR